MTTGPRSQCDTCVHFRSPFSLPRGRWDEGPFCAAFPTGIPDEVFHNGLDHRQPVQGDHGVRWTSGGEAFPEWAFQPDRLGVGSAETARMHDYDQDPPCGDPGGLD